MFATVVVFALLGAVVPAAAGCARQAAAGKDPAVDDAGGWRVTGTTGPRSIA
jgi:hypothetical protein